MPRLCYCVQINLLVQSEIEILLWILAFCWLSRLLLWFRFPHEFNVLLRSFVSEAMWVGSCLSGGSRLETRDISGNCCVTSRGSRVGITELFAAGSAMLRLWHGLGLFRWLVSRRESSGPASRSSLRGVGGWVARTGRESESTLAPCF